MTCAVSHSYTYVIVLLTFPFLLFFFFHDTATTQIYTLSLHDALPISFASATLALRCRPSTASCCFRGLRRWPCVSNAMWRTRSEEHTSELQSHSDLVCRLLLEKKKKKNIAIRDDGAEIVQRLDIRTLS